MNAAALGAKVERWPDLEDRFFEDLELPLVDVSEKVAQTHSTEPANRILYKAIADAKGRSSQRWLDERLETTIAELAVDVPEARPIFRSTVGALKYAEDEMYTELSKSLQAVLRDDEVLKLKDSPEVGNILRTRSGEIRLAFLPKIRDVSKLLRQDIESMMQMPESDLLDTSIRVGILAHPLQPRKQPVAQDR